MSDLNRRDALKVLGIVPLAGMLEHPSHCIMSPSTSTTGRWHS